MNLRLNVKVLRLNVKVFIQFPFEIYKPVEKSFLLSSLREPFSLKINSESIIEKRNLFHHQIIIKKCENVQTVSVLSV